MNIAIALLPVLLFLGLLLVLDSFKLVSVRSVALALAAGAAAALVAGRLNEALLDAGWPTHPVSRYAAPLVEETLKALWVLGLVRRRRVGFLVDAAILGFAVGAGFALVENVEYLRAIAATHPLLWLARGFGTAVLHGATTAIVAILAKGLSERHRSWPAAAVLAPGLLVAVAVHSAYNHFFLPPLLATAVLLTVLPLLLLAVFARSERAMRDWLGLGLDSDLELVQSILSGEALQTRLGEYLRALKARFPGEVVADMLCLVRVQAELAIRAKGLLLAREAGLEVPVGDDVRDNLRELRYLQKSIGPTGMLALAPVLRHGHREIWQLYLLEQARPS